ncbi:MAG: ATP cone domain-containing protein [Candidatus Sedimenticola sp. (ex Thyasira tokunagai)]
MGKVLIRETAGTQAVPFLRGILTRSLQGSGLSFEQAYRIASEVRSELSHSGEDREISSQELRKMVGDYLGGAMGGVAAERYMALAIPPSTIYVLTGDGRRTPFSRARHQHFLEPCCITSDAAGAISAKVYEHLLKMGSMEIPSSEIRTITSRYLKEDIDSKAAQRYLKWSRFVHSNRPLLVMIGGTAGCGKSTIATELAHRLDIVRIQSTDMLREVMRMMVPKRMVPALHTSSFRAWEVLPQGRGVQPELDEMLANGYRTQAELLSVACEGAVQRALQERVPLILEGVHIYPGLLQRLPSAEDALIVPLTLGVLKPDELRGRLKGRSKDAPDRRSKRYLKYFDNIWRLQSYLLSEADKAGVPIILNDDKETAMQDVMRTIIDQLKDET